MGGSGTQLRRFNTVRVLHPPPLPRRAPPSLDLHAHVIEIKPHTAHTTNLVHFLYVAEDAAQRRCEDGILADVAPTLLALLGVAQPAEMTGRNRVLPL